MNLLLLHKGLSLLCSMNSHVFNKDQTVLGTLSQVL